MAEDVVDQVADRFVELMNRETEAYDRVFRDRSEQFESVQDLPAIDVRIGEDDPVDGNANGPQSSQVRINVDLYVRDQPEEVSRDLLRLRKQSYALLMAGAPKLPGVAAVTRILPGGAEPVLSANEGSVPLGYLRTAYFVTYTHSLTDRSQ